MADNSDVKNPVDDFLDEYQSEMETLRLEARRIFKECYKHIGQEDKYKGFFAKMEKRIKELSTLSFIDKKIKDIQEENSECYLKFHQLAPEKDPEPLNKFRNFDHKIQNIIGVAKQYASDSLKLSQDRYEKIKNCHFGEQENKTKNALLFQEKVLELIDWLFINELERMDLREIEDGSQR